MIKNVIFDIGNVILNFDYKKVLERFTNNEDEQDFIMNNIIKSPEWLGYGLIDTGFITRENAIKMVQDRTNHMNDELVENFWKNAEKLVGDLHPQDAKGSSKTIDRK